MESIKDTLYLFSDLYGFSNSDWQNQYISHLKTKFNIECIDVRKLAEIPDTIFDTELIHKYFVNGGIEIALKKLVHIIKNDSYCLAFSIGGVIAWKLALLENIQFKKLVCVSSTRLRLEIQKPNCESYFYFGEKDIFIPIDNWFENLKVNYEILKNEDHNMYRKKKIAEIVSKRLIV